MGGSKRTKAIRLAMLGFGLTLLGLALGNKSLLIIFSIFTVYLGSKARKLGLHFVGKLCIYTGVAGLCLALIPHILVTIVAIYCIIMAYEVFQTKEI